ncbi:cob(I)yrinic acid a,c-diamide adenosyltransferase [Marinobacterium sp. MBR-109]|jgi:cob(I)alamin adenosyltransferase|uniref:cob(I)yrinic acid a,c-diamide adenosyltransferase n=1 Tax=Marinobacterium sp. MBR-109 TaxID=3156462 RepID=UPI003391DC29
MSNRLTRIYTRSGDSGTTALANGQRIPKYHPRIEALGDVDELNSLLGLLLAELDTTDNLSPLMQRIQNDLFDIGGELAVADPNYSVITQDVVLWLEQQLDSLNTELPPLEEFILPGGNRAAAQAHLCRCVCRRAERRVVELAGTDSINPHSAAYLNRLSDLLFVCARTLSRLNGGSEVLWQPRRPS